MFSKCKRIILVIIICALSISELSMSGCSSENVSEIGSKALDALLDDSPEYVVTMALDKFFKLYSEFDVEGLNDYNRATDSGDFMLIAFDAIEKSSLESDKIDGMFFVYEANLYSPYSRIRSADFLKFVREPYDRFIDKFYGDGLTLEFEYEIEKIYKPEDLKSIGYMSGLKMVAENPEERIKDIFKEKSIHEWYGVEASVSWKLNGAKYGYSKDMDPYIEAISNVYSTKEIKKDIDECKDRKYQFIVYKYHDNWYVYAPQFVKLFFSKNMIFEEK